MTHDKKTAENTALAVIADAGSDYPFDSGLYLFPDEPNLDYDIIEDYKNKSKTISAGRSSLRMSFSLQFLSVFYT